MLASSVSRRGLGCRRAVERSQSFVAATRRVGIEINDLDRPRAVALHLLDQLQFPRKVGVHLCRHLIGRRVIGAVPGIVAAGEVARVAAAGG